MTKSKWLTPAGKHFEELVQLFTPFVLRTANEEIDRLLQKGFTIERIEACIAFVEGHDTGRLKKAAALILLKKKRKAVLKGEVVTLSKREYKFLRNKVSDYLPEQIVRCWIHAVTTAPDIVPLSEFDDAMLPPGAVVILYREAFKAFGIDPDVLLRIFCNVRETEKDVPVLVVRFLVAFGYINDPS